MKRLALLAVLLSFCSMVKAQLYIHNVPLDVKDRAYVYVNDDVEYVGDTSIEHRGTLEITGDWYNNSVTDNRVFINSTGIIRMSGEFQTFNGALATRFPKLILEGLDKKQLREHIEVDSLLDLTDRELDANGNTVSVLSADVNAVQFESNQHGVGFVSTSTSKQGWLIRNTRAGEDYIYPLGYVDNIFRFRPLVLSPEKSGEIYAQYQQYDPAIDNHAVSELASSLTKVNSLFYHNIRSEGNADNNVTIKAYPYNTTDDGTYTTLVEWDRTALQWKPLAALSQLSSVFPTNDNQFGAATIFLTGGQDVSVNLGTDQDSVIIHIPNVFTPNGDGANDRFVIRSLENFPENELVVFNRWNNTVYEQKNYANNWDGSGLNEGTYFYVLRVRDTKGKWYAFRGFVMIVRGQN